jgi:hypothetical protein
LSHYYKNRPWRWSKRTETSRSHLIKHQINVGCRRLLISHIVDTCQLGQ